MPEQLSPVAIPVLPNQNECTSAEQESFFDESSSGIEHLFEINEQPFQWVQCYLYIIRSEIIEFSLIFQCQSFGFANCKRHACMQAVNGFGNESANVDKETES